tara:strand:- start:167 stop:415 length:249 start_codon:yes stop_codon:yes gene_type:complete
MMTNIFYTIALLIAGYSGYNNLEWYFIIISAIAFSIGWGFARLGQIPHIIEHGSILKLISYTVITYSILSGVIYFIALSIGN